MEVLLRCSQSTCANSENYRNTGQMTRLPLNIILNPVWNWKYQCNKTCYLFNLWPLPCRSSFEQGLKLIVGAILVIFKVKYCGEFLPYRSVIATGFLKLNPYLGSMFGPVCPRQYSHSRAEWYQLELRKHPIGEFIFFSWLPDQITHWCSFLNCRAGIR